MTRSPSLKSAILGAAVLTATAGLAHAQATCAGKAGPDVIVGVLTGPQNYAASSGVGALDAVSFGTTSCNMGTQTLHWDALPQNTHPVIGGNLYKFKVVNGSGRFEQIGLSWLKHGFLALANSDCCTCQNPGTGALLGIGCSDPYTASRNGTQSGLGPRWQVNAHTGGYPAANPVAPSGGNNGRIQVLTTDLEPSSATIKYFGESQYITPDDASAGNQNNNASHIGVTVTGTTDFTFGFTGSTVRAVSAIREWANVETGVTLTDVQVPGDGLYVVGSKATSLGGGIYHYEYFVYNMNGDRDGGSFSVPIPAGSTITNVGFHGVTYRGGDGNGGVNFSSTDWTNAIVGNTVNWSTTAQGTDSNANAIRFGTTYNFRFDANVAPAATNDNVTLGLWKTGSPASVTALAQIPGCSPTTLITSQPASANLCPVASLNLSVGATVSGTPGYQWQRESAPNVWVNLSNGSTNSWDGNLPGVGGIISGATTATLNISADVGAGKVLSYAQAIRYQVIVTGACGSPATSTPAQLTLCTADYNCDQATTIQDIFDYLAGFFASDNRADFDHVNGVNVSDIFSFLGSWFNGCP